MYDPSNFDANYVVAAPNLEAMIFLGILPVL